MQEEKRLISSKILFTAIKEQLAEGRQAAFTVTGMSMWPFLCHGRDQVIVEAVGPKLVKKGDVILFEAVEGKYILHRITKLLPEGFETTGDGNCFRDGIFPYECITARVIRFLRDGKEIDCNAVKWKVIFRVWMFCFPVRRILLKILKRLSKHISKNEHCVS